MKNIFRLLTALMLLACLPAQAQQPSMPASLSLQQALQLSATQNLEQRQRQLTALQAADKLDEQRNKRLPQLSANAEVRRNLVIPTSLLPAGIIPGSTDFTPIRFGNNWGNSAGVTLEQTIFDPAQRAQRQQETLSLQEQQLQVSVGNMDLALSVEKAYYQALAYGEALALAEGDVARSQQTLQVTQARIEAGSLLPSEGNQARIRAQNSLLGKQEAAANLRDAQRQLCLLLGLAPSTDYSLSDSLPGLLQAEQPANDTGSDHRLLALKVQQGLQQAQDERLRLLPSLRLNAYYGGNNFSQRFEPFSASAWYGNSYVALKLQIPLSEALTGGYRPRLRQYKQLAESRRLALLAFEQQRRYQQDKAADRIALAAEKVAIKQANKALALQQYQEEAARYAQGRILPSQLLDGEQQLRQAQYELLQAQYELLLERAEARRVGR